VQSKAIFPIHGLHVLSQYCSERLFWTDARLSNLLNASSMSANEDLIKSALQWHGNTTTFKGRQITSRKALCHHFDVARLALDAV
jgi:hypothetical protein